MSIGTKKVDLHHDKQYSEWVQQFHPENKGSKPGEQDRDFSNAEINLYECRYQEGDDLHHNERYNEWIRNFILPEL